MSNIPDYNFNDLNRWLDQQDNVEVLKFTGKTFSDALADLVVEPAKSMMPKMFAHWSGRLWAVLAAYFFFVITGNLLEFAAPLVGSALISMLLVTFAAGLIAQHRTWFTTRYQDFIYWWHTR